MLICGGENSDLDNRTWIYDPKSNSWEAVRERYGPQKKVHHTLVTLCHSRVLLFGGSTSQARSRKMECSNETWMFDMIRKEWTLIKTTIRPQSSNGYVTPRCRHTAAVVRFENSSCSCKESMLIFGGFSQPRFSQFNANKPIYDLWLLTCKGDHSQEYEWVRLRPSGPKLNYPRMVSAFNNTIVYLYGRSPSHKYWAIWAYRVSTGNWTKCGNVTKTYIFPELAMYVTYNQNHFLVLCCMKPLAVFDILKEEWVDPVQQTEAVSFNPSHQYTFIPAKVGKDILVYSRDSFYTSTSFTTMWKLTVRCCHEWHWWEETPRPPSPVRGRLFSVGGLVKSQKEVLLLGGIGFAPESARQFSDNNMHRLDLTTMKWSVEISEDKPELAIRATGTILLDSVLVVYGGIPHRSTLQWSLDPPYLSSFCASTQTWFYYNRVKQWFQYSTRKCKPPARMLHAAVATNTRTMMVYGGMILNFSQARTDILRDLWSLTLSPLNNYSNNTLGESLISASTWRCVDQSGPNTSFLMSLATIDNTLFMYGGSDSIIYFENIYKNVLETSALIVDVNCSNSLWKYNLSDSHGWSQVHYGSTGPGNRCFHDALSFGNRMLVLGGCSNYLLIRFYLDTVLMEYGCPVDPSTSGVWVYDPSTITWLRLSSQSMYHTGIIGFTSLVWNDLILSFCGMPPSALKMGGTPADWMGFYVYKPMCPPGTRRTDLQVHMCTPCSVGHYSELPHSNCSRCPKSLTTLQLGSTSRVNCSQCLSDYCGHGSCTVTLQGPAVSCDCQLGFTKDNEGLCTVPTSYIAASGTVAGVALLILVAVLAAKFRKARKRHSVMLRNKDHELMELTNSWNIDSREIRLRRRIDRDSPGGYGEVYQADYREMTVAVKKLQGIHQHLQRIELEFEREIEVMRTIRHPNIVLFLGGGRYHDDSCPFLVVEYMPRGSLATILKNEQIDLEDSLKMRFAVDAAKGMRFLHNLRPPRVHRDLKSANLLVSRRWVVKVADFGTARLVRDEGIDFSAVRGEGPLDATAPLLHADYQLSSGVGTPKWCAPEIMCGSGYGTPADVYR